MSFIGLLVLAAAPVAADQPPSADPTASALSTRPRPGQCQVRAVAVHRGRGDRPARRGDARPVGRVTAVRFEARIRPSAETTALELHVFTPNGHLYRKLEAPVAEVDHDPAPTPLRKPEPTTKAEALLPVAGTNIVRSGLYGQWTVVPHLADDPQPCGRPVGFELAP